MQVDVLSEATPSDAESPATVGMASLEAGRCRLSTLRGRNGVAAVRATPYHRVMSMPAIDIEKLAPEERLELISELWESLRAIPETVALTPAQRTELKRRLDELDSGTVGLVPWDEVKRRLTASLE